MYTDNLQNIKKRFQKVLKVTDWVGSTIGLFEGLALGVCVGSKDGVWVGTKIKKTSIVKSLKILSQSQVNGCSLRKISCVCQFQINCVFYKDKIFFFVKKRNWY